MKSGQPARVWTLRRWLRAGVGAAAAVLIALGWVVTWTLARSSTATDELVNRIAPAQNAALDLENALVNQETGIRGYGLTGQKAFLQPYTNGLAAQQTVTSSLRRLTAHDAQQTRDLDLVLARASAWQRQIADPIAAVPAGAPIPGASSSADTGKHLFDELRTAAHNQQQHLQQAQTSASRELAEARTLRTWILAGAGLVITAMGMMIFAGLRRGVTTPLARLSTDTTRVARGDHAHPISESGPAELRSLARDIEAMRQELVRALAVSEDARATLDGQALELRRSNQELEQFAYVASHDLQEPLRKVASFCQLLQRRYQGQLDERADQYIGFAVDGANRMQVMINDLLEFSRVGRVHLERKPVDLEDCFTSVVDSLAVAVEETGATIEHNPLPTVLGDATQLTLLLQNLLSNALKFRTPGRPPQVNVTAERDAGWWRMSVTDNGIGIDPAFADRVFLIFQRLHTKDAYPGSGIGLAMCKKIVEYHGGTITIDTQHNGGAKIDFTLPAEPQTQADAT